MLNLLLCIPAAVAALQDAGPPHLRAVPEEITGFVALNDLPDLLDKGRQNSWYRFFLDPQLAELRYWFDLEFQGIQRDAAESGMPTPMELAAALRSVSVFVAPAPETPFGAFGVIVEAREDQEAVNRAFDVSYAEMAAESELVLEQWGEVELKVFEYTEAGEELDGPGTIACFELDGVFGLVGAELKDSDREHVLSIARSCIDRLKATQGAAPSVLANPRYTEARGAREGQQIEAFVDVESLVRFIPGDRENEPIVEALVRSISSIPWVYGSVQLGVGEDLHGELGFRCDPDTLIGQLLGVSRPVPRGMLQLMPPDSVAISAGAIDVEQLVELLLAGATKYGPQGMDQKIEGSLSWVRGQFGVDPLDDIILLFSGEFGLFQRLPKDPSPDLAGSPGQVFSMMETVVLGLRDGEALLENVEELLTVTGLEVHLEVDDYENVDIYSLSKQDDVPVAWIITDDFLAISGRPEDLHHLIRAMEEPQRSVLDDERLASALEETAASTLVSVSDTAAVLKMMGSLFDVMATSSAITAETAEFSNAMRHFGSAGALSPGLVDKYFSGLMYSSWTIQDGRVRLQTWGR